MEKDFNYFANKLENWAHGIGFNGVKVQLGDYSEYDRTEGLVTVGMAAQRETMRLYKGFLEERYGIEGLAPCPQQFLSFLHELGHVATLPRFEEGELSCFQWLKEGASSYRAYWSVPDEEAANEWVVEFLLDGNNDVAITQLWGIITELGLTFVI